MPEPNVPDAAGPATAWQAAWQRTRRRASRTVVFMIVLCVAIAGLLWAWERGPFGYKLVYSFAIGCCCWGFTEGLRLVQAAATDGWRRWRGLALGPAGFEAGWRGIMPALLFAMLLGPPLGMSIGDRLTGLESPSLMRLEAAQTRITVAMTLVASIASVFVLSTMERLSSTRALAESAQRLAAENQLRLLQSQLEPHMLFNTLANLRVLIGLDPPRAQAMLDHLIAYLRSTLAASRAASHPLATEFERVADYLALMAVRMGPRLDVALALPPELSTLPVPPLLLQPLVENSIQHGLEPKVEGGRIEVAATREDKRLVLTVRDSGIGLSGGPARAGGGFGLSQVRERLATVYGGRARFDLSPAEGGGALARIEIPLP